MKKLFRLKFGSRGGKKAGFTLIEVLVAATIFTVVSLIAVNVFISVIRIQRRVQLENAIYEDARVMMERVSRAVRENTIDYEEYYNKAMNQDTALSSSLTSSELAPTALNKNPYGYRYGCYAQRFYNPGTKAGVTDSLGVLCNDDTHTPTDPGYSNCTIDHNTLDINTNQNPYAAPGAVQTDASAFCDKNPLHTASTANTYCGPNDTTNHNIQNELYLIDPAGTQKTIFALKAITTLDNGNPPAASEHALAMLQLTGQDNDNDGVTETWRSCDPNKDPGNQFCCSSGFDCKNLDFSKYGLEDTLNYNANLLYVGFVPISPARTNVSSLTFLVAPLEDPRKAAHEGGVIQQQPHVTIVLTVQPSASQLSGYNGDIPTVTIQTTITSRVYNEVTSFHTAFPSTWPTSPVGSACESY